MKQLFTKYQKNAPLGALFPQKSQGISNLLFIALWVLMVEATQAQTCSSVSMDVTPLSVGVSKADVNVKIAWPGTFSAEEIITFTGSLGSLSAIRKIKVGNTPTPYSRKDRPDFNTSVFIGSPQVVALAARIKNPNTL